MSSAKPAPAKPITYAERELEAVHEAKAIFAGEDECCCRTCKKVRAAIVAETRSV